MRAAWLFLAWLLCGCGSADPCDGQDGACLSITVQAGAQVSVAALDAVRFQLGGVVQHSFTSPLPAGASVLPVQVGVLLPANASGNVTINAAALLTGQVVASGGGAAAIQPGAHVRATVTLSSTGGGGDPCKDGAKNGTETDVDCGGSCGGCASGKACATGADCQSGTCSAAKQCVQDLCKDGVKDGTETDVDCGGSCARCGNGKTCAAAADCQSSSCSTAKQCLRSAPAVGAMTPSSGPTVGGTAFTLTGRNFLSGAVVRIGGTAVADVTRVSAATLTGTVPDRPGGLGPADVTVVNPDGDSDTGSLYTYAYYGKIDFAAPINTDPRVTCGGALQAAVTGDFNRDGKLDLAATSSIGGAVCVMQGLGNGGFGQAQQYLTGSGAVDVALGDFNNDGAPDLAVANQGGNNVSVLLGGAGGAFGAPTSLTSSYLSAPAAVAAGDVSGDGVADIVVGNYNNSYLVTFLSRGATGGFNVGAATTVTTGLTALRLIDLNGDGKLDVVMAAGGSSEVRSLISKGDGTFNPSNTFSSATRPTALDVTDYNRDGKQDVLVANTSSSTVGLFIGAGGGAFYALPQLTLAAAPQGLDHGDFNGDGVPDFAAATQAGRALVRLGVGDGTFQSAALSFGVPNSDVRAVLVRDLNGDGKPDILALNALVSVLLNTSQ